jgi:hypothetical protein
MLLRELKWIMYSAGASRVPAKRKRLYTSIIATSILQ